MKILYSDLKKYIPGLHATPEQIAEFYTMTGLMLDSRTDVSYNNHVDTLFSLEVRQNRADCFCVLGLVRELAASVNSPIQIPSVSEITKSETFPNITIVDERFVRRLTAIQINNVTVKQSPQWLKEYVELHGINSINLLVDLSNYTMLLTGYPNHIFDMDKVQGSLQWRVSSQHKSMITLGSNEVQLHSEVLTIEDDNSPLALAGAIGGDIARVDENTHNILIEVGVYDPALVMRNSRSLSISTETSRRLEKNLDPHGTRYALELLVSLVLQECGGIISSEVFDFFPGEKDAIPEIPYDPHLAEHIAGVPISSDDSLGILQRLNFTVDSTAIPWKIVPPTYRTDISIAEDIAEEVIRFVGYNKIPSDEIPALDVVTNITPEEEILVTNLRPILISDGYDEILSSPLITPAQNVETNYAKDESIIVENAVNEEFTALRQSLAAGLMNQVTNYLKQGISTIQIFEIGTVFSKKGTMFNEKLHLGLLHFVSPQEQQIGTFWLHVDRLLKHAGITSIDLVPSESGQRPQIANESSCWLIMHNEEQIGVIYKTKPLWKEGSAYIAEINIHELIKVDIDQNNRATTELTQRMSSYDINIVRPENSNTFELAAEIETQLPVNSLWSISLTDRYKLADGKQPNLTRYTFRISYINLAEQDAKLLHEKLYTVIPGAEQGELP
ncbi:phenylalanine--tRNA ligase subunit beta [candidate division WWE3 bacterium]|nr:phenylalanine--tRNA ligase subunit beta [candidate division WWE3 bacterium]